MDDDLSQMLRDLEGGLLSARQLKKTRDNEKGYESTIVSRLLIEKIGSHRHATRVEIYALIVG